MTYLAAMMLDFPCVAALDVTCWAADQIGCTRSFLFVALWKSAF